MRGILRACNSASIVSTFMDAFFLFRLYMVLWWWRLRFCSSYFDAYDTLIHTCYALFAHNVTHNPARDSFVRNTFKSISLPLSSFSLLSFFYLALYFSLFITNLNLMMRSSDIIKYDCKRM